jgi:alcohol dehydrogenase
VQLNHYTPTDLRFGPGRFREAGGLAARLGRRALLVTTRSAMERLGHTQRLLDDLRTNGVAVTLFKDFRTSPTTDDVDRGVSLARAEGADCVVAFGGGSALDCGKAIAAVCPGPHPTCDYLYGRVPVGAEALPVLAIPTTAGTGSEVNRSCLVTDTVRPYKDALRSDHLFPRFALVDPELTYDLPRQVTAQTGFDALSHAIESYVSPKAQPVGDALALHAVRAIARNLPKALDDPHHAEARGELALASCLMGFNLSTIGTCLPHRLDKAVCALHPEISHGQAIACIYVWWAKHSHRGNPKRFEMLAVIADPTTAFLPREERAAAFADVIRKFLRELELDRTLRDFGVTEAEVPVLAENVAGDLSIDPVPLRREDLSRAILDLLGAG